MADTRVVIDVDLNTSPAAQGLRDLQREFNAFASTLNKNNAVQATASRQYADQLMRLVNSSQMFTAETVRMRTAAGQLDQTLSKGKVTMGQFFSARFIKDSNAAAQVLSLANARAAALQTQFFATSAAANGMRDAIAVRPYQAFNDALAVSAQKLAIHRAMLMQATTHMINFGKNTQWAGRQLMVGFTVPLTIFGGIAGKVFKEIETELVNFKKVYGDAFTPPDEMNENLEAVKGLAKEYTKYGIAVKDTIALAAQAAATGAQNADLIDATRESTRLATLGQMNQNQALETTIALQTAFNISGQELAKTINFLNMVENQTVVTLQDLAAAIPRVAPVIKGLGGSVEDMAVMLAAMREGGVTAEQGANALKSGLASLINPTDRAVERLQEMGIALDAIVQTNRGDLMGTVQDFAQALATLDDFSRQQALEQVFGKFQYARLGALFNNIIRDGSQASRVMDTAAMSAEQLAASAEKELGAIEQATSVQFTAAMEKLKLAIAPIGETFMKLSIPILQFLTKIVEKFNELPDFAKKFAAFAAVVVGVVIPAGTMFLGLLMNLVGTLIKFGSLIGIAFKGFTSGGIKGAIDAVSQAINYMSLEEIDASIAAQQLGESTVFVNEALRRQIPITAEATLGINQLGAAYGALVARQREAAAMSAGAGGAFVAPGAAGAAARRGVRPQGLNKGGKVKYFGAGDTVPGSGNKDTVPAMLTPGEFIVNKKATKENLDLLQSINDGTVQYRNKGGGIATPGRMFYGRMPIGTGFTSADDFVAMAMRGENPLEARATAQAAEVMLGRGRTSLPRSVAPSQVGAQVAKRAVEEIIEPAKRSAYRILQRIGVAPKIDSRGSVGYHTRYNQQLKPENDGIPASLLKNDLLDPRYDSFAVLRRQADEWNRLNPNDPVDANAVIRRFTDSLEDLGENIVKDDISQVLYRQAIGNRRFLKEIDKPYIQDASYSVPAAVSGLKNNGYTQVALPTVPKGFKVKVKDVNGYPTVQIVDKDGNIVSQTPLALKPNEFIKDQSGKANIWVNDPSEGLVNLRGMQGEIGRAGAIDPKLGYKSVPTPKAGGADIQFAHANKGGLIQFRNAGGEIFESGTRTIVPGVGNTDTVPAMLTPGEFVVNKQATRDNKDILKAINGGLAFGKGGKVPGIQYLNEGGLKSATVAPGSVAPETIFGFDKNGNPITNRYTATNMLGLNQLYGWDGKPTEKLLTAFDQPVKGAKLSTDDLKEIKKFKLSRSQKIWALISALSMGTTISGMALYERNKRNPDPLAGYNKGGRVPAMLTPGEFIVNKDATENNLAMLSAINGGKKIDKYAIGGLVSGAAQFALPMGISLAATPLGAKAGEAMGGESGAMVGAIVAGMLPFLLPWGKMFGAMKGGAGAAAGSDIKKTTTVAGAGAGKSAGAANMASNFAKVGLQLGKFARLIPIIFNPWTALAAAVIGTAYTLNRMGKSNLEEFKRGEIYADALTTSARDIEALGISARKRAENMDQWLDQSESQFIQEEYAKKIAEAKNKTERKLLEAERDRAMQERGTMTRRKSYEKFYDEEIRKAKEAGATQDKLRRLYEQRNRTLGVSKGTKLDFGFDKTFGAEFIKGAGEKDFRQFQMTRDLANQARLGNVSQAEIQTISRLANAAYGATSSLQSVAELDMASKLAQYVLSGAMTEDQASSVAAAIGMELGNLKIGDSIRNELSGLVGAEGAFARSAPGSVALELMERNMRRTQEIEKITRQNVSYLLAQREEDQIPGQTRSGLAFNMGGPSGFNLFTQFFSGMADEARRNIGSLIEIQSSEYQMLQENIDAVGLAYNDLIAKAKTLQEAEAYRFERSRAIEKLQIRRDELQEQRQNMIFGSEQNRQRLMEIGLARQEAVFSAQRRNARARDYSDALPGLGFSNFFQGSGNIQDQLFNILNRLGGFVGEQASTATAEAAANIEETFASSFAQIMTTQMRDAALRKYQDTSAGAALQGLSEAKFMPISSDPIYAQFWQSVLDEQAFADIVPALVLSLDSRIADEVAANKVGHEAGTIIAQNLMSIATSFELPMEVIMQLLANFSGLALKDIDSITKAFDTLGDPELINAAYERFTPLLTVLGELAAIKLPNFGNKTLIESIMGDPEVFNELGQNDKSMQRLVEFFQTMEKLDPELQLDFLEQFKSIPEILDAMAEIEKTKMPKVIAGLKEIRKTIKRLSEEQMPTEEVEEFSNYLLGFIDKLNKIEDPEIRAKVTGEISPEFYTAMNALEMFYSEQDPGKQQQYLDIVRDNVVAMQEQERAITQGDGKKPSKPRGASGSKEDPLNDLMRQLRDTADLLSDIGTDLLSVNRKSKSTFDKLRNENVNEVVIDYLISMGPEQAIKVGEELLKNNKKLNTIMQLAAESEIARQQNATSIAQSRQRFVRAMLGTTQGQGFRALSGAPLLDMESALGDEEFLRGMEAARGSATPNRSMRRFQQAYFAQQQAERRATSAMAPTIIASQAQQNIAQTYAANQLRMAGLAEEEVQAALQSDAIMARVRSRLEQGKSIGREIIQMARDLYASTKTTISILDEGISKMENVFDFLSSSLDNAMQQIDRFTIKPLQDDLEEIQESNAKMSETQRRLSRSLSLLQKTESDVRERQRQDEEAINEAYDLRIEALEKVDKINKEIEDRQKSQVDIADALSRGDIGAAAKAAREMQSKFAQARREEALQAMRDQKEKDIQDLKESHEQELKNLTISVNGELLTREEIQLRIDDIEQKLYDNSLKEYDIQQKINAALKDRQKIEENMERLSIARQALGQLRTINSTTDLGERRTAIESTKQSLRLLGGPEADAIVKIIDDNFARLMSPDETVFGAAVTEITGAFGPLFTSIGSDIGNLNIQIPNIQATLDAAITAANVEIPKIFNGIKTQIDQLNQSIDVDPESDQNPFAKVYKAAKKVAALIEKAFANIKPPSGGGGGGGADDGGDGEGTERDTSIQLGTTPPKRDTSLRTRSEIIQKDGVTYRVTRFYNRQTGQEIPHLIKYDIVKRQRTGTVGGAPDYTYETVAEDIQLGMSPEQAERRLPTNQLPSYYYPRPTYSGPTVDQRIPGAGRPGATPPNPTAMGFGAVGNASSDFFGSIFNTMFGWLPWNNDRAESAGKSGGQGYEKGYEEHFNNPKTDKNMSDPPIDSVERGQQSKSPAKRFNAPGEYGAQGYVEGFKDYFDAQTDRILAVKIMGWFRRSVGIGQGESYAAIGIGNQLAAAIASAVSDAYKTLTTPSLVINIVSWLKRSLGMEGDSISSTIKLVGEGIAIGIKKGMEEWFGKLSIDIREPLKTWLNNAFGIVGGQPSTQSKPIGGLVASGIKAGMQSWFETSGQAGVMLWQTIENWLNIALGIDKKQNEGASTKTRAIGEQLTLGIAKGMETMPDLSEMAKRLYVATGSALGLSVNSKNGSVSPGGEGSKFYQIGVSIIDTIIKGINDQNASSRLDAAVNQKIPQGSPTQTRYFGGIIRRAFGGMIGFKGSNEPAPGMMMGGTVKKYAIGGFVPGRGMTDKVPALLTPGEFVVRKAVAQKMLPQLKKINSQVFPGMGMPQQRSTTISSPQFDTMKRMSVDQVRFGIPQNINSFTYPTTNMNLTQSNSEVNPTNYNVGPTNVQYTYNVNVSAGSNATPDDIANTVMYKIKRFDDRRIKGTEIG